MGLRQSIKDFVDRIDPPLLPSRKGAGPSTGVGNAITTPFVDDWQKIPSPSAIQLVRESIGTAFACGKLNSELVASTRLRLYVRTTRRAKRSKLMDRGDVKAVSPLQKSRLSALAGVGKLVDQAKELREVVDHPVLDLLDAPNDPTEDGVAVSRHGLFEITQRYMEFVGRSYWYIEKDGIGGTPSAIWLMPPQYVMEILGVGAAEKIIQSYTFNGSINAKMSYAPEEVIPFRFPDLMTGGYTGGFGPLRACFEQVKIFRGFAATVNALLRNSGKPAAMWTPKGDDMGGGISAAEAARMRLAFRQMFAMAGAGGVMVSEFPGALTPIGWKPTEMLDVEQAKEIKTQIANCFDVPTTKLDRNDANLASAKTGDYAHAKDAGLPRLRRMESVLNQVLLPMYEDPERQLFFAYDDPAGLQDDQVYENRRTLAVNSGAMTRSEQRAELGLEPEDWANAPLAPRTMVAVDEKGNPVHPTVGNPEDRENDRLHETQDKDDLDGK